MDVLKKQLTAILEGAGLTVLYLEYIDMLKLNVVSFLKYVILVH